MRTQQLLIRLIALALLCALAAGCSPAGVSGATASSGAPTLPSPTTNVPPAATPPPTSAPTPDPLVGLARNADGFARVSAPQLAALLDEAQVTLVHVPLMREWGIPGAALYIPANELPNRLGELPDRDAPIVLYCRSGNVSQAAARFLVQQGYTNMADLEGGYRAWRQAGYPLLDRR